MAVKLRKDLEEPGIVVHAGAYDALSAKIAEKVGFEGLELGSFNTSASLLGMPDIGLISLHDMVENARRIQRVINIPIVVDTEAGFGDAMNVMRMVREFENAGVGGLFFHDQVFPQRYSFWGGRRELISTEAMVGKLEAAKEARDDPNFVIIARTEGPKAGVELKDAIERGRAYAKAGADVVWVITKSFEDHKKVVKALPKVPVQGTLFHAWGMEDLTIKDFEDIGIKVLSAEVVAPLFAAARAVMDIMREFKKRGSVKRFLDRMITIEELFGLVEAPKYRAYEKKFIPSEE